MPLPQILSLFALTLFAIYRQTRMEEVARGNRFNMALIYAGAAGFGLITSGWHPPQGIGWAFFFTGFALSAIVGAARGMATRLWIAEDGRYMRKGTVLTVGLFVAMLATKIGIGTYAHIHGIVDGASFAGILIVVAIMVAAQAEIVFRRANALEPAR